MPVSAHEPLPPAPRSPQTPGAHGLVAAPSSRPGMLRMAVSRVDPLTAMQQAKEYGPVSPAECPRPCHHEMHPAETDAQQAKRDKQREARRKRKESRVACGAPGPQRTRPRRQRSWRKPPPRPNGIACWRPGTCPRPGPRHGVWLARPPHPDAGHGDAVPAHGRHRAAVRPQRREPAYPGEHGGARFLTAAAWIPCGGARSPPVCLSWWQAGTPVTPNFPCPCPWSPSTVGRDRSQASRPAAIRTPRPRCRHGAWRRPPWPGRPATVRRTTSL